MAPVGGLIDRGPQNKAQGTLGVGTPNTRAGGKAQDFPTTEKSGLGFRVLGFRV